MGHPFVAGIAASNMVANFPANKPASAAPKPNDVAAQDPLFAMMIAQDATKVTKTDAANDHAQDSPKANTSTASEKKAAQNSKPSDGTATPGNTADAAVKKADKGRDKKKDSDTDAAEAAAAATDVATLAIRMAAAQGDGAPADSTAGASGADTATTTTAALADAKTGDPAKPNAQDGADPEKQLPDSGQTGAQSSTADGKAQKAGDNTTDSAKAMQQAVSGKDAALLSAALKESSKETAPQQTTEANALPVQFDAASAAKGGSQKDSQGKDDSKQQPAGSTAAAPNNQDKGTAQTSDAAKSQNTAPLPQATEQPSRAETAPVPQPGATTIAAAAQTPVGPATLSATLHVAPQSVTATQTLPPADLSAFAVQVAAKLDAGIKQFDIRMDPPELGRVDVRLSIDDAGKVQAHLAVEKPQTLALMQKDSGTLERALKDTGLNLSQSGLNFSLKGQDRQNDGGQAPRTRSHTLQVSATAATGDAPSAALTANILHSAGDVRLDIRV